MLLRPILLFTLLACAAPIRNRQIKPLEAQEKALEVFFDWNHDGALDRAALDDTGDEDFYELGIWLSSEGGPRKVVSNQSFIYAHTSPGSYLDLLPNGDIDIITDHTGVGASERIDVWRISMREKDKFWLINYRYEFADRLDKSKKGVCDLDLLEGRGHVNGDRVSFRPLERDINSIDANFQPKPCKFKFHY